jgi:F-type H+-transporting ATPase subunit b
MAQRDGTVVPQSGGPAKVFPPLDPGTFAPQLVWLALSFGLLYVLLKRVVLPRVSELIEERGDRIKRDLAQAEEFRAETEQALANYKKALADAKAQASTIAKGMHQELAREVNEERAKAEAEIAAKVSEAERSIAETKARAVASVEDIANVVAGAIVARLLGQESSKAEVKKALVQRAAE